VSAEVRSTIALLIGIVTLRLALSTLMLNYVRPGMRIWLIASGAVLCFLGALGFLRALRPPRGDPDEHAHDHDHPPSRAAWLLLLPVLALSVITPQALGSFAAERQTSSRSDESIDWAPLADPIDGAVEITLAEFNDRAFTDSNRSLEDATVRLIGFVTAAPPGSDADFVLNRFAISCCAADARTMQVEMYGATAPRVESWVKATGTWKAEAADEDVAIPVAALSVKEIQPIPQPEVPYE
jgi:uncharacterized repeat protein (TIGR03943 family)